MNPRIYQRDASRQVHGVDGTDIYLNHYANRIIRKWKKSRSSVGEENQRSIDGWQNMRNVTSNLKLINDKNFHSGKIRFATGRTVNSDAKFVRISHETAFNDPGLLHRFMCETNGFGWKLDSHPSLLVSVTGSALGNIRLRPKYFRTFADGLMRATTNTNAWIITGGTDTGIMKTIGDMMALHQTGTPCIGIAVWGCINQRGSLDEENMDPGAETGGECTYPYGNDKTKGEGALLNANHSHFVLVDTGKTVDNGNPWAGEIPVRTTLEDYVCRCSSERSKKDEWMCLSDNGWIAYEPEISKALTVSFNASEESYSFERNGQKYEVLFRETPMKQRNLQSGFDRDVEPPKKISDKMERTKQSEKKPSANRRKSVELHKEQIQKERRYSRQERKMRRKKSERDRKKAAADGSEQQQVPSVMLVYGGGPGTFKTM